MLRALLPLVLSLVLSNPVLHWVAGHTGNPKAAQADAGGSWDPTGARTDSRGNLDPDGAQTDGRGSWDPDG